jgi:hypothetical protein
MNRSCGWLALLLSMLSCSDPADGGDDGGHSSSGRGGSAAAGGTNPGGTGGTNTAGSGAGTAGSMAGSGGGSACNTVPADAPEYPQLYSRDPAPTGKGGIILDGTYFVTSSTWYEAPQGLPEAMLSGIRIEIAGTTWQEADVLTDNHFTVEATTESNTLTTTQTCPTERPAETSEYTAEGDEVTVYVIDGPSTFGLAMSRQ